METLTSCPEDQPTVDPNPGAHVKIIVEGCIEVCAGCRNALGYNVAWELAAHATVAKAADGAADEDEAPVQWEQISCEESEALLTALGPDRRVVSGRSDMDGTWGDPLVETQWAAAGEERPALKNVRYPGFPSHDDLPVPDRKPCEHYRAC